MFENEHTPLNHSHPGTAGRWMIVVCLLLGWMALPWLFWQANRVVPNKVPLRHLERFGDLLGFSVDGRAFITWVHDGRGVVTRWDTRSGKTTLWDPARGEKLVEFVASEPYWRPGVAVSPDRATFIIRGFEKPFLISDGIFRSVEIPLVLRDMPTAEIREQLLSDDCGTFGVAYSPDGRTLAFGDNQGKIRLWDRATSAHHGTVEPHSTPDQLAFSPDGKVLVASDWVWTAKLIDLETGRQSEIRYPWMKGISLFSGSPVPACLAVSDESVVLGQAESNELTLWHTATGQHRSTHSIWGKLKSLAISADGQIVAACQSVPNAIAGKLSEWHQPRWATYFPDHYGAAVLDAASGQQLAWIPGPREAVFLAGGHTLAGFCPDDNSIRIWEVPPRRALPGLVPWSATAAVTGLSLVWWLRQRKL